MRREDQREKSSLGVGAAISPPASHQLHAGGISPKSSNERRLQFRAVSRFLTAPASRSLLPGFLALFLAFPNATTAAEPGTRERTFLRALEIFDAAKSPQEYREAASQLESLLADGFRNGAVYYNLGNAYFRAGEYGRAIAAYRKAKPYRPRDPYLDANLRQALSVAPGRLPEAPLPWWTHVFFWTGWLSLPEKAYAAFAGFLLAALIASAALLLRRPRAYWISGLFALAAAVLSLDASLAWADVSSSRHAVVTVETNARKGIGKDYEPAFDQPLRDGAEFTILSENGDWVFGHFEGIGDGWLRGDSVAR